MRIDLHTHSSTSDGTEPPSGVMRRAAAAGLDVVALTDHDTQAGHDEARRALPPGLTLVPGMELSCRLDGHSVHMLAFGADPADAVLAAECERITEGRLRRGEAMVRRLRELGVEVTWQQVRQIASGGVVGRPHIARAMVAAGAIASPEQAFTPEWIGTGGRAYVSRYAPDPVTAVTMVTRAGGATVLAHPGAVGKRWRIPDDVIARLASAGLAGLEVFHPDQDPAERLRLAALATDLGLVTTGGSDDHGVLTGHRMGAELTPPDAYDRLMSVLAGPAWHGGAAGMMSFFDVKFFWEVFVTLLVITDPPGVVPPFLALTRDRTQAERARLAWQSALVALGVIVAFALFGQSVLAYLGVELPALQGAGGLLLLLVALQLLTGQMRDPSEEETARINVAFVPLGTPLLAGPGAIVATMLYVRRADTAGQVVAFAVALAGVALALWLTMRFSGVIHRLLRPTGVELVSRIAGLLLSAIAVQLVADAVRAFVTG